MKENNIISYITAIFVIIMCLALTGIVVVFLAFLEWYLAGGYQYI